MRFDVNGKTALVTGANRGIGKAIVQTLIEHGAKKAYAAVRRLDSAQPLVDDYGDRIAPVTIDLQRPESIAAAAKTADDVELVVNNAGVLRLCTPLADDAIGNLKFEMEVNAYGLLRMAQAFAPVLSNNGGGAFVQLNSVASLRSLPSSATYAASKAAAYSLTQALRRQLAEQGTQVLSVHPGPIGTDMADEAGLEDTEPPSVVAEGLIAALAAGKFHLFPDAYAKEIGQPYAEFAETIVEAT